MAPPCLGAKKVTILREVIGVWPIIWTLITLLVPKLFGRRQLSRLNDWSWIACERVNVSLSARL